MQHVMSRTYLSVKDNSALAVIVLSCTLVVQTVEAVLCRANRFGRLREGKNKTKTMRKVDCSIAMKTKLITTRGDPFQTLHEWPGEKGIHKCS